MFPALVLMNKGLHNFAYWSNVYAVVVYSSKVGCGVGCIENSKFPGSESSNQHSGEEFKIGRMNIIYPLYQVNVDVLYFLGAFGFL
jgi:hypothetical protein